MGKLLIYICGSLFQSVAVITILTKVYINITNKQKKLYFIYSFLISLLSAFVITNQLRLIYSITMFILLNYFILKLKDKRSIIYSSIIMMCLSISELFITVLFVILGFNSEQIVKNSILNLITNIVSSLFSIIIVVIPWTKKILIKVSNFFELSKKAIKLLYIFLIILYLLVSKNGIELILKNNFYLNLLLTIGILILIFLIVLNEIKQNQLKEINSQTLKHLEKYEKIITEQGKANHEFKNQLMVIKGYYEMNSPKLKEYLDEIVKQTSKSKSTYLISQLNKFPDGGIKGLLYYKFSEMEDYNIKYELYSSSEVKNKFNKISTDIISDITRVLGVLIDNAIEASKEAKEKLVSIDLTLDKSTIIFEICNTYKGKINKDKLGTGYTTKGKGRGYGLKLVNDIIKSNDIYEYNNIIEENLYKALFKINARKKKK